MSESTVAIHIVTWNSLPYIRWCMPSLKAQTYPHYSILIIDNASSDETCAFLAKEHPDIPVIHNTENRGFAAAHNQATRESAEKATYVLVLNPDAMLTPTYIETLVGIMEQNPHAAGITGQLLRYRVERDNVVTTNIIDSEGFEMLPWRQVRERHAGMSLRGAKRRSNPELSTLHDGIASPPTADRNDRCEAVWGISGACALYRMSALEDAKLPIIQGARGSNIFVRGLPEAGGGASFAIDKRATPPVLRSVLAKEEPSSAEEYVATPREYFDEDFFCYKEDVDLAWRLGNLGWQFLYTPQAIAYHHRGIGKEKPHGERPTLINYWSYRNHFYTLLKNETWSSFLLHAPLILPYE